MHRMSVLAGVLCALVTLGSVAHAQQQAAPPPPPPSYGPPVTTEQAKKAVAAALTEAKTKPYLLVFAVVDPASRKLGNDFGIDATRPVRLQALATQRNQRAAEQRGIVEPQSHQKCRDDLSDYRQDASRPLVGERG